MRIPYSIRVTDIADHTIYSRLNTIKRHGKLLIPALAFIFGLVVLTYLVDDLTVHVIVLVITLIAALWIVRIAYAQRIAAQTASWLARSEALVANRWGPALPGDDWI